MNLLEFGVVYLVFPRQTAYIHLYFQSYVVDSRIGSTFLYILAHPKSKEINFLAQIDTMLTGYDQRLQNSQDPSHVGVVTHVDRTDRKEMAMLVTRISVDHAIMEHASNKM